MFYLSSLNSPVNLNLDPSLKILLTLVSKMEIPVSAVTMTPSSYLYPMKSVIILVLVIEHKCVVLCGDSMFTIEIPYIFLKKRVSFFIFVHRCDIQEQK